MSDSYPQLAIISREQWRQWLADHGAESRGVWAVTWKKTSGKPYVSYEDLVEEAIAAGWVDSRVRRVDDARTSLLMTPRRPKSRWSDSNKARVEKLTATGLMQPAGMAAVAAAHESGAWDAGH